MISVYLNTVICAMLFYTCFCRLVRTNRDTHTGIRLAFCVLATASALCLLMPFVSQYRPQWPSLVMEGSMLLVQAITALYWRDGVPAHFQRCVCDWEVTT